MFGDYSERQLNLNIYRRETGGINMKTLYRSQLQDSLVVKIRDKSSGQFKVYVLTGP